jgi:predicted molibdopterin-dependent oxidoreductase YjgC
VRQAIKPQGDARPDWQVISELAHRIGPNGSSDGHSGWNYSDTSQIMTEIAQLTPIYAGISHDRLERAGCLQWPVKNFGHPGTPILSMESFKDARARFTRVEQETTEGETTGL